MSGEKVRKVVGRRWRRRGAVTVQVAVLSGVIMGFAALAIDVGMLYTSKAELQAACDSAALAAAAQLSAEGDTAELAREAAAEYAARHKILGDAAQLDVNRDVEFGRAAFNPVTNRFEFQPSEFSYDAVRVTVRRTADSPGGSIPLLFANSMGVSKKDMWARATAVLVPRDIAVVIDLSNSMSYDSQLRFWDRADGGSSNLRDVWAALNGPEPDRPYLPGPETETEYAADTGPTFGAMTTWGDPLVPRSYKPASDPGLWYIPKGKNTSVPAAEASLAARGYSAAERSALLSGAYDGTASYWVNRTGVILGLALWHSGKSGGLSPSGGDGDNYVEDKEVEWIPIPSFSSGWTWKDYIKGVGGQTSQKPTADGFAYRYGLKTLVDYILQYHPDISRTDNLWATPAEPLRATKDAVQTMINVITALNSMDHLSLEVFATSAHHQVDLTDNLQSIADTLYQRQAGHWDTNTCIGGGLACAINELKSSRARAASAKVIVLMSDGVPNVDEAGRVLSFGASAAVQYAYEQADRAGREGIRIYCVSVGYSVDRSIMQTIAAKAHGQEFFASGSPEEYTEQLEDIFRALGGKRPVALIE